MLTILIDLHANEGNKLKDQEPTIRVLAGSHQQLPKELEDSITAQQERTFVQIQSSEGTGYSSTYNDYSPYDDNGADYNQAQNYAQPVSYSQASGRGTAVALYDFAGEQSEDLPFYAGDVIKVLKEDDGSGWLTGELNGRTGIFPTSYVQRQ